MGPFISVTLNVITTSTDSALDIYKVALIGRK